MPTPDLGCSRRILRTVEDDPKPLTNFADNSEPWACIRRAHNSSSKQNRQAECDRLTALPRVVRTWRKCPVRQSITHEGKGATKLAHLPEFLQASTRAVL